MQLCERKPAPELVIRLAMTSTNEDDVKTDAWTGRSKRRNLHTLYHKNPRLCRNYAIASGHCGQLGLARSLLRLPLILTSCKGNAQLNKHSPQNPGLCGYTAKLAHSIHLYVFLGCKRFQQTYHYSFMYFVSSCCFLAVHINTL